MCVNPQGAKVVMVDHAAQQLLFSGHDSQARYPLGPDGGIIARVACTATPELLRSPAADTAFRRYLDGSDVALDDMLVVPIMRAAAAGGGDGGGGVVATGVQGREGHEAETGGDKCEGRLAHPDVVAVMQVRRLCRCMNLCSCAQCTP